MTVVWSQTNHIIVTVKFDKEFYDSKMDPVKHFFVYGMLPEIIGKWYTRKPVSNLENIVHIPTSSMTQNGSEEDYTQSYGVTVMSQVLEKWYAVRMISVPSSGFTLIA